MTLQAPEARRAALEAHYTPWTGATIWGALDRAVERYADQPLVMTDESEVTYREVQERSRRIAAGLVALGIEPGEHVALVMANYPDFAAVKFGIARAGAVCIPINFLYRARELAYVLNQSDAKLLITMDHFRDLDYAAALDELSPGWEFGDVSDGLPALERVVVFDPEGDVRSDAMSLADLESLASESTLTEVARREAESDPSRLSDILYTSGTTGEPKGVMITHDQVVRVSYGAAYDRALEEGRRLIYPMPMYHVFGYMECLMAVLFVGGAVLPQVVFDAPTMLRTIERRRVNEVVAVPAVTLPLLAEARRGAYDISSVHTVFSSGGVAPQSIWSQIRDVFGESVAITTGYGMTETTATTFCTRPEDDPRLLVETNGHLRRAGVAGAPELDSLLVVYKAVDLVTGEEVASGEPGELLAKGPIVTSGYYRKPEETERAFTPDGWLRTGDVGTLDDAGNLRLTGRVKETLRVGGEMVMPREIEAVLEQHPGVLQAYVCGIPHERMGEVACAFVIAADPDQLPDLDELQAICRVELASFKVPRNIFVVSVDELPTTVTGRVQKFRLSELGARRVEQLSRGTAVDRAAGLGAS